MNEKIAIDVVLLLPKAINNVCIELNIASDQKRYVSFKDGYNPHVTLGMGSILTRDIANFKKELGWHAVSIKIPEIVITSLNSFSKSSYHFNLLVSKSLSLFQLHYFR